MAYHFPLEIWHKIALEAGSMTAFPTNRYGVSEKQATLNALSTTCTYLLPIASEQLYSHITLRQAGTLSAFIDRIKQEIPPFPARRKSPSLHCIHHIKTIFIDGMENAAVIAGLASIICYIPSLKSLTALVSSSSYCTPNPKLDLIALKAFNDQGILKGSDGNQGKHMCIFDFLSYFCTNCVKLGIMMLRDRRISRLHISAAMTSTELAMLESIVEQHSIGVSALQSLALVFPPNHGDTITFLHKLSKANAFIRDLSISLPKFSPDYKKIIWDKDDHIYRCWVCCITFLLYHTLSSYIAEGSQVLFGCQP